jgi:hypothetical protein
MTFCLIAFDCAAANCVAILYGQPPIFSLVIYLYLTIDHATHSSEYVQMQRKVFHPCHGHQWNPSEVSLLPEFQNILRQPLRSCNNAVMVKFSLYKTILAGVTTANFFNIGNLLRHS